MNSPVTIQSGTAYFGDNLIQLEGVAIGIEAANEGALSSRPIQKISSYKGATYMLEVEDPDLDEVTETFLLQAPLSKSIDIRLTARQRDEFDRCVGGPSGPWGRAVSDFIVNTTENRDFIEYVQSLTDCDERTKYLDCKITAEAFECLRALKSYGLSQRKAIVAMTDFHKGGF